MQSKVGPIPYVAIMFVALTSICVAVLVSLYLTLFIFANQGKQLNRIDNELQTVLYYQEVTPTMTPVPTASPSATLKPVTKTSTVIPATTSAK